MFRTARNTSLLDLPSEVRILILEKTFEGSEHQLRLLKEEGSNSLWLQRDGHKILLSLPEMCGPPAGLTADLEDTGSDSFWPPVNYFGPPPEVLFVCKQIYQEGRPIYGQSLTLNFVAAWITDTTSVHLSQLSQGMQDYYFPRLRRIRTSRLGMAGIPWKRMLALQRVDMILDEGYDGGTVYLSGSCSEADVTAYFMDARDQRFVRTIVRRAKQGYLGELLHAMLMMEKRHFSVALIIELREEMHTERALVSKNMHKMFVSHTDGDF